MATSSQSLDQSSATKFDQFRMSIVGLLPCGTFSDVFLASLGDSLADSVAIGPHVPGPAVDFRPCS
jgi:hypothetical protein